MEHGPQPRCDGCLSTRERCGNCKWVCKCESKFTTKSTFRNHLRKNKNDGQKLLSKEYVLSCYEMECCKNDCLKSWTFQGFKKFFFLHFFFYFLLIYIFYLSFLQHSIS